MKIIVGVKSKTAREIAKQLNYNFITNPQEGEYYEKIIRWGKFGTPHIRGFTLNRPEAIQIATNKALCRKMLREEGLPVPHENENKFPVIGRTQKHKRGKNFFICRNEEEVLEAKLNGAVYFARYYPKKNEYRVHVGGNRVLLMSVKEGDKSQLIWNHSVSNFTFRHLKRSIWLNDPLLRKIARKAKLAIQTVGLDFGAVDIMAGAGEGWRPYVISEINTAPSLSPLAIEKYINYFRTVLHEHE